MRRSPQPDALGESVGLFLERRRRDHGATQIAWAYAYIGDADQAFAWLERADAQRDPGLIEINAHILIRNLHGDPRWQAWLARLGLAGTSA